MLRKSSYIIIALALAAMAASSTADPARASATAPVSPVAAVAEPQSCDACKPRITAPTVRYLRHNGSMHEVEVSFTFGLPGCFGSAPRPDFRVVVVQLNFPNNIVRNRANAGVGEGGPCTGSSGSCKTLVRVSGPASDGRPRSYFASVEASVPILGHGVSGNNTPF